MLRSALRHRKISRLAELLKIPRYAAVGLVECLWHLTAVQAPRGDIGKLTDQEIADGVFWPKRNSKHLIDCLSSDYVRLIDRCTCHRLRVHDWCDHSDQSVKKTVAKDPRGFISCYLEKVDSVIVPESHRNGSILPEPECSPVPGPIPESASDAAIDRLDEELAFEESRFNSLAVPLRDEIQSVLDSLPRSASRSPFSASWWLRTGRTGISRSDGGLIVLRLTNDALEARQRAQEAPILSENNRKSFDAIDRVTARLKARRDGTPIPREIEG